MWKNCTEYLHQKSPPSTPKSYEGSISSPRIRFPQHNYNTTTLYDQSVQFPPPVSVSPQYCSNYAEAGLSLSPVYAFPYPLAWTLYQSPRGIGRRFGVVPATPRTQQQQQDSRFGGTMEAAAVLLSPPAAAAAERRGLNVSSMMSTTRGIKYGPVDEELHLSQKLERFKVRIVEIEDVDVDVVKD